MYVYIYIYIHAYTYIHIHIHIVHIHIHTDASATPRASPPCRRGPRQPRDLCLVWRYVCVVYVMCHAMLVLVYVTKKPENLHMKKNRKCMLFHGSHGMQHRVGGRTRKQRMVRHCGGERVWRISLRLRLHGWSVYPEINMHQSKFTSIHTLYNN